MRPWYRQRKNPFIHAEILDKRKGLVKYRHVGGRYVSGIVPEAMFVSVWQPVSGVSVYRPVYGVWEYLHKWLGWRVVWVLRILRRIQ